MEDEVRQKAGLENLSATFSDELVQQVDESAIAEHAILSLKNERVPQREEIPFRRGNVRKLIESHFAIRSHPALIGVDAEKTWHWRIL